MSANVAILRDAEAAQQFLLQGLWLQRTVAPVGTTVKPILQWALQIIGDGQPMPPIGVIGDFGHAAFGIESPGRGPRTPIAIPGLPAALMREYEDHVLGKVYADASFERASDALRRFQGKDRARGLAYVVRQFRDRAAVGGVELSPGIVRTLLDGQPDDLLRRGWESLSTRGPMPLLVELYEALVAGARRMAEILAIEDIIALEQRTALADMGQYVAHRQVLQTAQRLEAGLPRHKVRPLANRQEVPTRVLDEDTYPVGGFNSISTKGTIESLLHSQLAFMEKDAAERPDLFDVKFVRDELYYYSRDENQFLRRRRTFLFVLGPDLVKARYKDPELPVQRIVMVLALLLAAVRKLSEWLGTDALKFEFLLVKEKDLIPLSHEGALLEMLFREQITNRTVEVRPVAEDVRAYADRQADRSMCHLLTIGTKSLGIEVERAVASELIVDGPLPEVQLGHEALGVIEADDPVDCWVATLERLLALWI